MSRQCAVFTSCKKTPSRAPNPPASSTGSRIFALIPLLNEVEKANECLDHWVSHADEEDCLILVAVTTEREREERSGDLTRGM